jgi:hypothetical protein
MFAFLSHMPAFERTKCCMHSKLDFDAHGSAPWMDICSEAARFSDNESRTVCRAR